MKQHRRILIVSDIHYACEAERGCTDYEARAVPKPWQRMIAKTYRHHLWLRDPLEHHQRLDTILAQAPQADFAVANGDYSCDTGFVGVSDANAFASVVECTGKLRAKYGHNLALTMGDHELGKLSLFGGTGGLRLASWRKATGELGIQPYWQVDFGNYRLCGVASTAVALPVFKSEALPEEAAGWEQVRAAHLREIAEAFANLRPEQRVILFCHDPTALPFLLEVEPLRERLAQIELTIIGHLHSNLVFRASQALAGMPEITFLGHTPKRLSKALRQARCWRDFRVQLCPSVTGIQLLKDGGYSLLDLDLQGGEPARLTHQRVPW